MFFSSTSSPIIVFMIVILVAVAIFLAISIPVLIVRSKYRKFVLEHSVALKRLNDINKHYNFNKIPKLDLEHSYDNENFYGDISCKDYLTYQLVYMQKKVERAIDDTIDNKNLFDKYKSEIKYVCVMDQYGTTDLLKNRKRLREFENKLFAEQIKTPTLSFSIMVRLRLTNINGAYRCSKCSEFFIDDIENIIYKLNQKRGDFYLNEDVWQSICRVERGKVTNRMRFAIYKRDNYCCKKCGRRTNDLEIDHIIPIAKGGKSTLNNLQTLCHRCNYNKGSNIE